MPVTAMMHGVIDMHLHAHPCLLERPFDEIECAEQARAAGYRGLVLKSIYVPNADRVMLVRKVLPGSNCSAPLYSIIPVGGSQSEAVNAAIGFGVKVVWLPTVHAAQSHRTISACRRIPGRPRWDCSGRRPKANDQAAGREGRTETRGRGDHRAVPTGGSCDGYRTYFSSEVMAVLTEARRIGYEKVVVTHVGWHATRLVDRFDARHA